MFIVDNHTRYAADRTAIIDTRGAVLWVVVVKATYDVAPNGSTSLAKEQNPPVVAAIYTGEPGRSTPRGRKQRSRARAAPIDIARSRQHRSRAPRRQAQPGGRSSAAFCSAHALASTSLRRLLVGMSWKSYGVGSKAWGLPFVASSSRSTIAMLTVLP